MSEHTPESIDRLAQVIRAEDSDHSLGAGALAEAIILSDWYDEVIRSAKADALREASSMFDLGPNAALKGRFGPLLRWLRRRAEHIEKEGGDER